MTEEQQTNPDLTEEDRLKAALADWWLARATSEIEAVVPKAVEYGAGDLAEIGRTMGLVMGIEGLDSESATELGIYFYVIGKLARWTAALRDGRVVSDDTLLDLGIYIKMAQRNRDVGGWPFAAEGEQA